MTNTKNKPFEEESILLLRGILTELKSVNRSNNADSLENRLSFIANEIRAIKVEIQAVKRTNEVSDENISKVKTANKIRKQTEGGWRSKANRIGIITLWVVGVVGGIVILFLR